MEDFVSIDGRMIRVKSCTERRGLWIEMFFPKRKPDSLDRFIDKITGKEPEALDVEVEPDNYFFIPGDIRKCVAEAIVDTELEVEPDDDEYEGIDYDQHTNTTDERTTE